MLLGGDTDPACRAPQLEPHNSTGNEDLPGLCVVV